jgi:hypothetical protein
LAGVHVIATGGVDGYEGEGLGLGLGLGVGVGVGVGVVVVLMLLEVPLHPAIKKLNATRSAGPNKTPIRRRVGEIACIYNLQVRMLTWRTRIGAASDWSQASGQQLENTTLKNYE